MGLFDFLKKKDGMRPGQLTKEEIGLLTGALSSASGKMAFLENMRDFGRGPMGPNALLSRMQQAAADAGKGEYADLARAIESAGKVTKAQAAKCIEAVKSRLADVKDDDPDHAKLQALLSKLKAL